MCRIFCTGTFPKVQRVLLEEITDSISGRLLRLDHKRDHGTVRRIQDSEQGKERGSARRKNLYFQSGHFIMHSATQ